MREPLSFVCSLFLNFFCSNTNFCLKIFIKFSTILYQSCLWLLQEEDISCPSTDRKSVREPLSFARSLYLNIFVGMQIFVSAFLLNFPQFYIRAVYEYYRKRIWAAHQEIASSERASQFSAFPIFEYFYWNANFRFSIFTKFSTILYQSCLWILQEEYMSWPSTDRK